MDYNRIYNKIIDNAKQRDTSSLNSTYYEKHHIIPRCIGGLDTEENIVILTPEEHYVCHQLLVKLHPTNYKLVLAVNFMTVENTSVNMNRANNKKYGWIKRKLYKQIRLQCLDCGNVFYRPPSLVGKFCSKSCHHNSKRGKVDCLCINCNKTFETTPYKKDNGRLFCSQSCKLDYGSVEKQCLNCSKTFKHIRAATNRKFCSSDCQTIFYHKTTRTCSVCESEFRIIPCNDMRKYCSRKCYLTLFPKRKQVTCKCCKNIFEVPPSSVNVTCKSCRGK